jgi:hypothetical protein
MTHPRAILLTVLLAAASCNGTAIVAPTPIDPGASLQGCERTSTGLVPLTDMRATTYQGTSGGLYPDGSNTTPPGHLAVGLSLARGIVPLDAQGQPSSSGRYVFVSIGMSNTTQEFSAFVPMANADTLRDPRLTVIDGAQGGQTGAAWSNPSCPCWTTLDGRLANANAAAQQVSIAWIKLADAQPTEGWPAYARRLSDETIVVLRLLKSRFPNLRLAYLSSRIYAGYATSTLNPEPYAYESGFSMRWVIEAQLAGSLPYSGTAVAPWVAWGPYLWADGLTARSDGLTWACSDLQSDGTHPSASGQQKVAARLLDFVRTDATAREWYLANP